MESLRSAPINPPNKARCYHRSGLFPVEQNPIDSAVLFRYILVGMGKTKTTDEIAFTACLKQSSPSSKPIKFGSDGDSEITLEVASEDMAQVVKMLTLLGETFVVRISKQ